MSVIYKALSTIDAAESVRHAYPGGADPAAARGGAGGRGGRLLLAAAVLLGLGGAAAIVAEPGLLRSQTHVTAEPAPAPAKPATTSIARTGSVSPAAQPVPVRRPEAAIAAEPGLPRSQPAATAEPTAPPASTTGVAPEPVARSVTTRVPAAYRVAKADSARSATAPEPARVEAKPSSPSAFVFEPAQAGGTAATPDVSEAAGEPGPAGAAPAPARAEEQAAAAPASRETSVRVAASRQIGDSPLSVERDTGREFAPVNVDHTRRVRMLNATLQRALKSRDPDEVARILRELEMLVGPDSSYMLKMRAFTQLTLGGDTEHAMNLLREVLVRDPGDEDAVLNMAVAEIGIGEVAEARARLEALAIARPGDDRIDKLLRSIQ